MTRHKVLYIPIEEALRDLEPRLLLAYLAIQDGWTVVIGQQWLMHAAAEMLPPGVFFFKGANQRQKDWMRNARAQGHAIVAIEEEATAIAEPLILDRQMAPGCPKVLDLYLAQGPHHAHSIKRAHPDLDDRVQAVGVARFDLLRPEFLSRRQPMVDALVAQHDDFVLINTNFGYTNSHWGSPAAFFENVAVGNGFIDVSNSREIELFANRLEFEKHTMDGFIDLIDALAKHVRIVLRPHLAEDLSTWERARSDRGWGENVAVIRDGPAIDWILASRLLIQNSCTTGVEAALIGHPVVSYVPYVNAFLSCYIGNEVMPSTADRQTVVDLAIQAMSHPSVTIETARPQLEDFDKFYTRPNSGLVTTRQWRAIHDAFDPEAASGTGPIFALRHLELDRQPDWSRIKFSTDSNQIQAILAYIGETLGEKLAVKGKVLGDNLFALAPG